MRSAQLLGTAVVVGIGTAVVAAWFVYCRQRRRHARQPVAVQWHYIGVLREIHLFPLKSGASVRLEQAKCDEFGLSWNGFHNRSLLPLTAEGKLVGAGSYPHMLGIRSEILGDKRIRITAPNAEPMTLDLDKMIEGAKVTQKRMQGFRMQLVECRPEHHRWFSRAILQRDDGIKLFITLEPIRESSWWRPIQCDFFPIMALHTKSVQDLNSRLSVRNKVHHLQFRGNFLIESGENVREFDEDDWLWMKIGGGVDATEKGTVLRYNSPCFRCILPNINVETCERNADFEPLRTLKTFRIRGNPKEPEMGVYFDVIEAGHIREGDPVFVQSKTAAR